MAKYVAYPEYKDSGVEWFHLIPQEWEAIPLKYISANNVKDGPHETPKFIDEGVPFFSVDSIQDNKLVFDGCRYISYEDHDKYSQKCLPKKGDVLLGKAASVGKVALVETDREFNVWSPLAVITPIDIKLSKFIFYSLQSLPLQAQCEVYSNSNTQKNLGMNTIDNLMFPRPSDYEAAYIANFLDHETAKIDTLIEEQQSLIRLLKEKRQAVISHGVTKGLNPDAPMKDSGVEWLGEVPEHWTVAKAKHVASVFVPQRNKPELNDTGYGTQWATMEDMKVDRIISTKSSVSIEAQAIAGSKKLKAGSVIASCVGNFGVAAINDMEVIINQQLQAYIPHKINAEFLRAIVSCSKVYFELVGTAATLVYVNQQGFEELPVLVPPVPEQLKINTHIEANKFKYDQLVTFSEEQVDILQERRTALISAAVTGKIDVRNWTAPEQKQQAVEAI